MLQPKVLHPTAAMGKRCGLGAAPTCFMGSGQPGGRGHTRWLRKDAQGLLYRAAASDLVFRRLGSEALPGNGATVRRRPDTHRSRTELGQPTPHKMRPWQQWSQRRGPFGEAHDPGGNAHLSACTTVSAPRGTYRAWARRGTVAEASCWPAQPRPPRTSGFLREDPEVQWAGWKQTAAWSGGVQAVGGVGGACGWPPEGLAGNSRAGGWLAGPPPWGVRQCPGPRRDTADGGGGSPWVPCSTATHRVSHRPQSSTSPVVDSEG